MARSAFGALGPGGRASERNCPRRRASGERTQTPAHACRISVGHEALVRSRLLCARLRRPRRTAMMAQFDDDIMITILQFLAEDPNDRVFWEATQHTPLATLATPVREHSMLAEWLCACEQVNHRWLALSQDPLGPIPALWRQLCAQEFPLAYEPGRRDYSAWRHAYHDKPIELSYSLGSGGCVPNVHEYKLVVSLRQGCARVVEFERPLHVQDLATPFDLLNVIGVDPGGVFGAEFRSGDKSIVMREDGVTHNVVADVYLKDPCGRIAHLQHAFMSPCGDCISGEGERTTKIMYGFIAGMDSSKTRCDASIVAPRCVVGTTGKRRTFAVLAVRLLLEAFSDDIDFEPRRNGDTVGLVDGWVYEVEIEWKPFTQTANGKFMSDYAFCSDSEYASDGTLDRAVQIQKCLPLLEGLIWH